MFLKKKQSKSIFTRLIRDHDERGAALASVLGVFAVISILALAISITMVNTLEITRTSQDDLLAQNEAESGIAVAAASINAGICPSSGLFTDDLHNSYAVQVQTQNSTGAWINGCPGDDTSLIRFLSTGAGEIETSRIAAEYVFNAVPAPPVGGGGGYRGGFDSTEFRLSGGTQLVLQNPYGEFRSFNKSQGNFTCTGVSSEQTVVPGPLYVWDGNILVSGGCNIRVEGDIHVSGNLNVPDGAQITATHNIYVGGNVTIQGGGYTSSVINGNIHAKGSVLLRGAMTINGDIVTNQFNTTYGNPAINGTVYSNTTTTLETGTISANLIAGTSVSLGYGNNTIGGNVHSGGAASIGSWTVNGNVTAMSSISGGTNIEGQRLSPQALPSAPPFTGFELFPSYIEKPEWYDYQYSLQGWKDFFEPSPVNEIILPTTQCASAWNISWKDYLAGITGRTVIDARGCSAGVTITSENIQLYTDIVIIARSFTLTTSTVQSNSSAERMLYLITPDGNPSVAGPQCSGTAAISKTQGQVVIHDSVTAMLYTPCTLDSDWSGNPRWNGTLYVGNHKMNLPFTLIASELFLPGEAEIPTGGPSEEHGVLGYRLSQLNYTGSDAPALP